MKTKNIILLAALGGLCAIPAHAIVPVEFYTYTFEAASGQTTDLNGSTITVEDVLGSLSLYSWNLLETGDGVDFTPLNSSDDIPPTDITSVTATTWGGEFLVEADNSNASIASAGGRSDATTGLGSLAIPYDPPADPPGKWVRGVPDGGSALELLAGSITALGAMRHVMRRRR